LLCCFVAVLLCCYVAVFLCCCVFVCVCVCVSLRLIGRSLRLSVAVVAQQRCNPGDAQEFEAAGVLSRDTSSCSCIFVASPPPSDAVLACWCVWTPVMRAAVCLLYVSAVEHRRVAALHVRPLRQSLAVCSRCFVVVDAVCRALVCPCMVSLSSRCDVHDRRSVVALSSGMTASGTCGLSGCVVVGVTRTRCCA
jgi:hypothetical protein